MTKTLRHEHGGGGWDAVERQEAMMNARREEKTPLIEDALRYVPGTRPLAHMEFVIQNFVRTGLYALYGPYNAGKTTSILTMSLFVAGVLQVKGLPKSLPRKVFYITEDPEQVQGIVEGFQAKRLLEARDFAKWFFIVPSKRRDADYWSSKLRSLHDLNGMTWGAPLVVFDTASSSMQIDDIKDNSSVGEFIAALKEASRAGSLMISVWIVMHVAKALREEVAESLTALGAQAWGADTFGEMRFTVEEGRYFISLGKRRFEISENGAGVAVDRYEILSEVLPVPVDVAPWATDHPDLAERSREIRIVTEFSPTSLSEAREERAEAKLNAASEKLLKEIGMKMMGLLGKARDAGAEGVCVWAAGKQRHSPHGDMLKGHVWKGFSEFSGKKKPRPDDLDRIRELLVNHRYGVREGELVFFSTKLLDGNINHWEVGLD